MRVLTMALLGISYYLLAAIALVLSFFTQQWFWLAYITPVLLFAMFVILVWSIPLHLNWSRNSYGDLMRNVIGFILFSIFIYSLHYYFIGIQDKNGVINNSFLNALYFSVTTWATLGYGDFIPIPKIRLLTSLEALTGLLTIPLTAAMVWLYCKDRLWETSMDQIGRKKSLEMRLDRVTGVFKEIESASTKTEQIKRKNKFKLNACKSCKNSKIEIEKYYEVLGVGAPLPQFSVFCKCGVRTKGYISAFRAAWKWNGKNRCRKIEAPK